MSLNFLSQSNLQFQSSKKEKIIYSLDFNLLLLYSLIPGIYKIIGNQLFMLLNIPIIALLLLPNESKDREYFKKFDIIFFLFLFYIFILNIIQYFNPVTNKTALLMGIFLDALPMTGYFYSRKIKIEKFIHVLIIIAAIHCLIGIILYPPFNLNKILGNVSIILLEGVAIGRMSSVSGSLGFGELMMLGFISALFYKKKYLPLLLIGVIFSMQRSAWLGSFIGVIFLLFIAMKQFEGSLLIKILFSIIIFIIGFNLIIKISNVDISFISYRFNNISNAQNERSSQWINGIQNFAQMPIGTGSGQVGQIATRYEKGNYRIVADGDYFRILSEYGLGGLLFYIFLISSLLLIILKSKFNEINLQCITALMGGIFIQMVGSNISEFYFNNFIYWTIIGYYFTYINKLIKYE
jgi:hypothetical protein